ncbi:MAG: ribonuclease HII [Verrucomicrobiae bacterium]|nr:ribonuclease HII [Verrucomicrobiae bacterium]
MKSRRDRFFHEREIFQTAHAYPIAGVDEAGRGPLAGPLVVAAVVLPEEWIVEGIPDYLADLNDSKKISQVNREHFYESLQKDEKVAKAIVAVSVEEIERINILQATFLGMRLALEELANQGIVLKHVLVDGPFAPSVPYSCTPLIKGDSKSYSIAAASILAKVYRDRIMLQYAEKWPAYGFERHKGYATREHKEVLRALGPCPIHRKTFLHLEIQGEFTF